MSDNIVRGLPEGFVQGPVQGTSIVGEITESLHRFLRDGWTADTPPPRIEEDLSFVPKDREEVVYVYMYRAAQNTALMNSKQWRPSKISVFGPKETERIYYERAPLYLNVFYLIGVHSKFRSDAERLLGYVLMRLHDTTHLVYRPRRYFLPEGGTVDSAGTDWHIDADGENVIMEKVSLCLVDDLTIGDAVNFFTINEAPYRPYLTYRAQCAMEGPLLAGPPTQVRLHRAHMAASDPPTDRPTGRMGRMAVGPPSQKALIGPEGFGHRPITDDDNNDSED